MSTTTVAPFPGFDLETMEGFNAFGSENPNDIQLGLEATAHWEGTAGRSLAKIGPWKLAQQSIEKPTRDFSIQFGAWKEVEAAIGVEGAHDRIEPVEAALAAMTGCITWAICINAAQQGINFDTLKVRANATVDPRVLLGIVSHEEAASCMQNVDVTVEVTGDDLTSDDRQRIHDMVNRSPVHAMVKYENNVTTTVNVG